MGRNQWTHTSAMMALVANVNRDSKKSRPFKPSDFNPYAKTDRRLRQKADKQSLALLREALEARYGSGEKK